MQQQSLAPITITPMAGVRRLAKRALAVGSLLGLIAHSSLSCKDGFSPPSGSSLMEPPPAYRTAWQAVEDCSGLQGNFSRVRWFLVPQPVFICGDGVSYCDGTWKSPHDIFLSEVAASDSASGYFTVRHEILHDLLGGGADHPAVFRTCHLMREQVPVPAYPAARP